jgi:hypothetical protein
LAQHRDIQRGCYSRNQHDRQTGRRGTARTVRRSATGLVDFTRPLWIGLRGQPRVGRRPDIIARTLAALREAGIQLHLVTTMPGRVSVLVESNVLGDAVRTLHATFIPVAPEPCLDVIPAA